jgi:hypothetical protein
VHLPLGLNGGLHEDAGLGPAPYLVLGHDTLPRPFEYVLVEPPQRPTVFAERGVEIILIATEMSGRRVELSHRFDDRSGYVFL